LLEGAHIAIHEFINAFLDSLLVVEGFWVPFSLDPDQAPNHNLPAWPWVNTDTKKRPRSQLYGIATRSWAVDVAT